MEKFRDLPSHIQFAVKLANNIGRVVRPVYGIKEKDVPVGAISRDFSYIVDTVAEELIGKTFERAWREKTNYGYATEDQGLVLPNGNPEYIYLIDPVDGSRPAQIGAEMAVVMISGIPGDVDSTMGNINFGVVHAIKEKRTFLTMKDMGVFELRRDFLNRILPRENTPDSLRDASFAFETYTLSNQFAGVVADPLLRTTHFKTDYPSGGYSTLSIVRGQNELQVDIRRRILQDFPQHRDILLVKPDPKVLSPMDFAGAALMVTELGGVVTDAYGQSLDNFPLWRFDTEGSWSEDNQTSLIAAVSPRLHSLALDKVEEGFSLLEKILNTL